jgi:hypothetical protein
LWFRVAVRFGSPWRHPFLRTGKDGIRLFGYHAGFFVGASIAAFCPRHSQ